MKHKAIEFISNFSYMLTSNLISMLISALVVLIIPKLIGVKEYGYWQLYIFYTTYMGFLHFGWIDGIYLRYGGKQYSDLDKDLFFSQFYMLLITQLIIAAIIFGLADIFVATNIDRIFIIKMTAVCMLILNTRNLLLFILQATYRIKQYSLITIMEKVLYFALVLLLILTGLREYKILILADLTGKVISLFYTLYTCRDIVFRRVSSFYFSFKETVENINAGIKLMFANIASMLIIGVVRFGIERSWDISVFGKVSLTLSVSNFMMLFIDAVGMVMFPVLRRTSSEKLPAIYETMRTFLMMILFGLLVVYYPMQVILVRWLPKYADSLLYMALLFPMCVYEGKMSLLNNTYLKTLRKEKDMFYINAISLLLSLATTFITTYILKNLFLTILSIIILLAFRCIFAELLLSNILSIRVKKDIILELSMTAIFISTGWLIKSWWAVALYLMAYSLYILIKRKDIGVTVQNIKVIMEA